MSDRTIGRRPRRLWKLLLVILMLAGVAGLIAVHHEIYGSDGEVVTSGQKRGFLLHVPKSYRPGQPTPLVLSFHGFGEWPAHLMRISGWNQVADEFGFMVAYPRGSGVPLRWFSNGLRGEDKKRAGDVQFISDLLDHLQSKYNIDTNRVYANGLSNGGGMSCLLACRLSERIAAIGSVSGAYLLPRSEWNAPRRVPVILFHGTADPLVPFHGGPSRVFPIPFPDIPGWVQWLGTNNGCQSEPVKLPAQGRASALAYTGCSNAAEVVFYTLAGGGHTWPGGKEMPRFLVGLTPSDISATRLMWDFFQQHPMKNKTGRADVHQRVVRVRSLALCPNW